MTKEIIFSDATKLAELIRTKEVSPVEVVQAHLDRIAGRHGFQEAQIVEAIVGQHRPRLRRRKLPLEAH